jgi:hypothetical protein
MQSAALACIIAQSQPAMAATSSRTQTRTCAGTLERGPGTERVRHSQWPLASLAEAADAPESIAAAAASVKIVFMENVLG